MARRRWCCIPLYAAPADLNGDCTVNGIDLSLLIELWGPVAEDAAAADFNDDGIVNGFDLAMLLGWWGGPTRTVPP